MEILNVLSKDDQPFAAASTAPSRPVLVGIIVSLACAVVLGAPPRAMADPSIDPELRAWQQIAARGSFAAQPADTPSPPRPAAVELGKDQGWADVWLMGGIDPDAVRALGGEVHTVAGKVMTARIPLGSVAALEQLAGLERAQLAQPVEFQSDVSTHEIGADQLWGGSPPNYPSNGITGKRVVIGIVDTGIDPKHQDFRTAAGSRVKWLWDQNIGFAAPPPSGFSYGSEYTQAAINAGQFGGGDVNGHGTHMAGVAAGNGRGTGNGKLAYTYLGVAPEADLVVVSLRYGPDGSVTDDKVLDGVRYVFQRAAALGEPAVVLLSLSKSTGPHDGQDPLDLGISALTGPGKVVCAAAGNYGGLSRHAEWSSSASGQTGNMTFSVAPYTPSPVAADYVQAEAWYDASANYSVSVITPGGQVIGPVARGGTTSINSASGIVQLSNGDFTSANRSYRVSLFVYRGSTANPQLAVGTWTWRLTSVGSGAHRADAWLTSFMLGGTSPTFVTGKTETRLVGSPATANNVVAVGAYSTKRSWTAVNAATYSYPLAALHDLANYSSPGPRRDGLQVPHVTGPGYGVAGARSSQVYPSVMYLMPDSVHYIQHGTSVAAAGAAGVVAQMLQSNASLTPSALITQLEQRAVSDAYTGAVPNARWGYGKLRSKAMTAAVGEPPMAQIAFAMSSINPGRGAASFVFTLDSEDLASGRPVRIGIFDARGRLIATLRGAPIAGPQQLAWDGLDATGGRATAGVYWARLQVGSRSGTLKFVRL